MTKGVLSEDDGKLIGFRTIEDDYIDLDDFENLIHLQSELFLKTKNFFDLQECYNIWQWYSWQLQASWLFFPENPKDILPQIESEYGFTSYEEISK